MNLPYGTGHLHFPDKWGGRAQLVEPGPFPCQIDGHALVVRALENPAGSPRLSELAREGHTVAVVIPDLTRRAAVSTYLPPLLGELESSGIRDDDITIIVALGIHRALDGAELEHLAGKEVYRRYTVVNHEADEGRFHTHLGNTGTGLPLTINTIVAGSDLVVLTGSITYHYFAGYGGGRKSLLPGVSSRQSCEAHHKMVVDYRRGKLAGELGPGILENNPVHRTMLEACLMAPPVFILNTVTEPGGCIVGAAAGELNTAHLEACRLHDLFYRREIAALSSLVIASAGGYPRDVNFVQAHKGLYSAHQAVTGDGVVILAAQCPEGTGNPDFAGWFERCRTESEWLDELEKNYQINGQTAFSTWLRAKKVPTVLVSELPPGLVRTMGMIPARHPEEALSRVGEILGDLPVPLFLPDAGDTLTIVRSAECGV